MVVRAALGTARWKKTRAETRRRDGGRCVVCGSTRNLVGGHRIPPERYPGSHDDPGNIWTLCQSCNVSQGSMTDAEWKRTEGYRRRLAARGEEERFSVGRRSRGLLRKRYS